jgi:hypothetical protein
MPSWVLPAVAAELWGVPVEQVLADIANGRAASRIEGEFLFVDLDPCSEAADSPPRLAYRRSLAWSPVQSESSESIVSAAERDALLDDAENEVEGIGATVDDGSDEEAPLGDAPAPMALTEDDMPDWQAVRARVSRTRRPPGMRDAA